MKKKLICVVLSVMLIASMLPLSVSASSIITWKNDTLSTNYNPYNIIIGDDGSSYIASEGDGSHGIMKYKADGSLDTSFGTNGIVLDNLSVYDMCFDANGDILTGSRDGNIGLVRVNHISGYCEPLLGQLSILGIATDATGNIYVNTGKKLMKYSSSLAKIWEKNCASIQAVSKYFEMGVLLLSDSSIVTTNRWLGTVQKYDKNGDLNTNFGTNGLLQLSTIPKKGIGFASYSDALYVACDEGFVKKLSDDGKNVTNVYAGNAPTVMVAKNGYYYIPSYPDKTITRFAIPGGSSTQEHFSCTATPSNVSNNSAQQVSLNITSNSTENYQVTAKAINKTSGDILDVQATTATLLNGSATVVLTPSSNGWPQGDYSIELCLSKAVGQSVISNTILADTTISVSNIAVITSQPQSLTAVGNQNVTLSVTASGSGTLSYQWYKDGKAISGATSFTYTITRAQSTDAGSYTVKISSSSGVIESNAAVVKVDFGNPDNVPQKQVAGNSTGEVTSAEFSLSSINNINSGNLGVTVGNATLSIPASIINGLTADDLSSRLQLTQKNTSPATESEISSLLTEKNSLVAALDFDLTKFYSNGSTTAIHQLGGKIKITLNLTDEQLAKITDASTAKLYYYNSSTKKLELVDAVFNLKDKTVTFYTDHFSTYVIGTGVSQATPNPATGSMDSPFIFAIFGVSSLAVLTMFSKKYFLKTIV